MKKLLIPITVLVLSALTLMCSKIGYTDKQNEEIATAKAPAGKSCFTVCDVTKNPDLQLVTNAEEVRPLLPDGQIDSLSYFFTKYHVRTEPIRLTQNYLTPGFYTTRYGWDSNVVVNRIRLQCLVENIAPFGCDNDWVFTEKQGDTVGSYIFFDGLFEFDTYEKGNGNNWKFLYTDFKKEFFPSIRKTIESQFNDYCYYDRAIQAQAGDFYYNYFRFPNHDGVYRLVIKFNPQIRGCRAVKETDYGNDEVTIDLEITNGVVGIKK